MRRAMLTFPRTSGLTLPGDIAIGDPIGGGYYAGIIDTTQGNIIAADASQAGLRYALIVSPKSLEGANVAWKTSNSGGPVATRTRWDGLAATEAMGSPDYPAASYCLGLADPGDGASRWYLPALDELELIYRHFKPSASVNSTYATSASTFPGGPNFVSGYNPSSDPTGASYTTSSPSQTSVAAFQSGGAEALTLGQYSQYYWSSTEADDLDAWVQISSNGTQAEMRKAYAGASYLARPVRRIVL